jgi:hypothetical protein
MSTKDFRKELMAIGIVSYSAQETLLDIAERCAYTTGIPLGGSFGALGAAAGMVTVPGVGEVPGWAVGFLVGLLAGTLTCTSLNYSAQEQLKDLAEGR